MPAADEVLAPRGVVERIATTPNRIWRLPQLFRLAPALRELEVVADRAPEDWAQLFARRYLKRLRALHVLARPEQHVVIRAMAEVADLAVAVASARLS